MLYPGGGGHDIVGGGGLIGGAVFGAGMTAELTAGACRCRGGLLFARHFMNNNELSNWLLFC